MDIIVEILAILCGIIGIVGCIIPALPGPPISYVGMLFMFLWRDVQDVISPRIMIIWLIITITVTILDFIVPSWFTKKSGGSKSAAKASLIGMIVGIVFFPPLGMIIGAFVGPFIAELLIEGKSLKKAIKSAIGAFFGFLIGTGVKLIASITMFYYIFISIF